MELDEMELWQIAVLLDKHKIARPAGVDLEPPPDMEKRAEMYQRVLEHRQESKKQRRR